MGVMTRTLNQRHKNSTAVMKTNKRKKNFLSLAVLPANISEITGLEAMPLAFLAALMAGACSCFVFLIAMNVNFSLNLVK